MNFSNKIFKVLNLVFFTLFFGNLKSQINYQLTISNLTKKNIEIDVNYLGFKNILPSQAMVYVDSIGLGTFELIKVKIKEYKDSQKDQEIHMVAANKSKILLEIFNVDSIDYGKGFKLSDLPFPASQAFLLKNFFPEKFEFIDWVKKEYAKTHHPSLSNAQKDSILDNVRLGRKKYLSSMEKMINDYSNSYLAYYLFKSEFMIPKNILAIGKEKVIEISHLLDPSLNKMDLGKKVSTFVDRLKSNAVGAEINNFRFKTMDDSEYDFHHYISGSKALLIFTARGCKACMAQIGIIKKIQKEHPGLKTVYVSLDKSISDWRKDVENSKYPGIITLNLPPYNNNTDLQDRFMVEFIPQLFFIDQEKKILYDNFSPFEDEHLTRLKTMVNVH